MSDVKIDYETWILIADGGKALFLENRGDNELPNFEIRRVEELDNPPDREQSANRPGRMADGGSGGHHVSAVQDTDWHELAKERFASDLADILYKMAHKGRFKKLVVVASPATLGELRSEWHKEVSDKIVGEIAKDLTNHPLNKIEQLLAA